MFFEDDLKRPIPFITYYQERWFNLLRSKKSILFDDLSLKLKGKSNSRSDLSFISGSGFGYPEDEVGLSFKNSVKNQKKISIGTEQYKIADLLDFKIWERESLPLFARFPLAGNINSNKEILPGGHEANPNGLSPIPVPIIQKNSLLGKIMNRQDSLVSEVDEFTSSIDSSADSKSKSMIEEEKSSNWLKKQISNPVKRSSKKLQAIDTQSKEKSNPSSLSKFAGLVKRNASGQSGLAIMNNSKSPDSVDGSPAPLNETSEFNNLENNNRKNFK